jgi:hypothetical protein
MITVRAFRDRLMNRKDCFIADQRGVVAFEMPAIYLFLMFALVLPLADVAIAGFHYISARAALRAFGQSIQYSPPPDVTNASSTSTWVSTAVAKADPNYPILTSNFWLICGDGSFGSALPPPSNVLCSNTNTASTDPTKPKYYLYATKITLAPLVLTRVLCTSGNANPCTFTLPYSERFQ